MAEEEERLDEEGLEPDEPEEASEAGEAPDEEDRDEEGARGERRPPLCDPAWAVFSVGTLDPESLRTFLKVEFLETLEAHLEGFPGERQAGVLLGEARRGAEYPFVEVDDFIPLTAGQPLRFNRDVWENLYPELERRALDRAVVGWYVGWDGPFPSVLPRDLRFNHETFFDDPFQVLLLVDGQRREQQVYRWAGRGVRRAPGHCIYTARKNVEALREREEAHALPPPVERGEGARSPLDGIGGGPGWFAWVMALLLVLVLGALGAREFQTVHRATEENRAALERGRGARDEAGMLSRGMQELQHQITDLTQRQEASLESRVRPEDVEALKKRMADLEKRFKSLHSVLQDTVKGLGDVDRFQGQLNELQRGYVRLKIQFDRKLTGLPPMALQPPASAASTAPTT